MRLKIVTISFLLSLLFWACNVKDQESKKQTSLIDFVDPFIGTGGKGKTYPGATLPHGMVQLSPDNGRNGWDWISGYFYPDSVIAGFSHLHLSGTGAGDLYDISFFPVSGELKKAKLDDINTKETVFSVFSHQNEQAHPGYYQVYLNDYQINVELTATERTGLQRYTFEKEDKKVRLHVGYTRNWDKVTDSYIKIINDTTIAGYRKSTGWARDQRVYFTSVFSSPFTYILSNDEVIVNTDSIVGLDLLAELSFTDSVIMVKTGISSVSTDNAVLNLATEQIGFDFNGVRLMAEQTWEEALNKVKIKADTDIMKQFYTAMYQSRLAPTLYSDANGEYKGTDGKTWTSKDHPRYSTYSLWDTYRALHPWLTIAGQKSVTPLMNSMLDFKKESGLLPVWNMQGNETNMMIGYHSVPVLTDAIFKGFPIDTLQAFEAMKSSAMHNDGFRLEEYRKYNYVPYDSHGWSVSLTLEYAYDDWCIAQVAKLLGEEDDYQYYLARSENYLNHFDKETGFFRAKSIKGKFKEGFDPLAYDSEDYCEANAWQYYWYVPHAVDKLIDLSGGAVSFEKKLDQMFEVQQASEKTPEWISGYIGQYVHGNEPSHHVPYLYQYVDTPEKTQQRVRQIMDDLYTTKPDGLAGNEDCGQMSAWYLFSALGFYPVNPADGKYVLGSPIVESASILLQEGKTFNIVVNNQSNQNVYVKSVMLNGEILQDYFITHSQIMKGGKLVFEMSNISN